MKFTASRWQVLESSDVRCEEAYTQYRTKYNVAKTPVYQQLSHSICIPPRAEISGGTCDGRIKVRP